MTATQELIDPSKVQKVLILLHTNVENDKLPLDLRGTGAASLAHLNYYYAMARANHYNILATGIIQLLCILFPS